MVDMVSGEVLPLIQASASSSTLFTRFGKTVCFAFVMLLLSPVLLVIVLLPLSVAIFLGVPLNTSNSNWVRAKPSKSTDDVAADTSHPVSTPPGSGDAVQVCEESC
jgi:hypothetical protein